MGSIVGAFQAFLPFGSSPLFGFLYRATVATFPAAFLLLVAGLKLIEAIVVLVVYVGVKRDMKKFRQIEETLKEKDQEEMPPLLSGTVEDNSEQVNSPPKYSECLPSSDHSIQDHSSQDKKD